MVVWFLFALWAGRTDLSAGNYTGIGGHLLIFVLFCLLASVANPMNGIAIVATMLLIGVLGYWVVVGLGGWVERHAADDEGWG